MKRKIGPAENAYSYVVALEPDAAGWKLGAEISISEAKDRQTDSQRGYYWMSLHKWGEHLGYTKGESEKWLHNLILNQAYGTKETKVLPGGNFIDVPNKRSSEARKGEYSELINVLIRFAGEQGFHIEEPSLQR